MNATTDFSTADYCEDTATVEGFNASGGYSDVGTSYSKSGSIH